MAKSEKPKSGNAKKEIVLRDIVITPSSGRKNKYAYGRGKAITNELAEDFPLHLAKAKGVKVMTLEEYEKKMAKKNNPSPLKGMKNVEVEPGTL